MKYFEDMSVGETRTLGPRTIELASMLAFAGEFDRQPFHIDEAAAKESIHQGLIASGIHTLALTTSLIVDQYLGGTAMVAGLGIDQLRFLRPVRPGDCLSVDVQVDSATLHPRRDRMGIVRLAVTTKNQNGQAVMSCAVDYGFARHPQEPEGSDA